MTIGFGPKEKQELADHIGGKLIEYDSGISLARGHSRGASHFRWLSILGFFVFPIGLLGLGVASNCMLDMSEPKAYYLDVVDENEYCHKDRVSVGFRDWRNAQGKFYIKIHNSRLCDASKRGDFFEVVIKEGFWGWPWIKDYRPHR
ncbi:MAG: hypothetical protein GY854_27645 [Deltaproteobacteria bacterium]|nr:hypothetical protein [Deltaproteobacteria bacterium]